MRVGPHLVASAVGIWSSSTSNSATLHAHDRLLSAVVPWGFLWNTCEPVFRCHGDAATLVPVDSRKRTSGRRSITMCRLEISDPPNAGDSPSSCSPPVSSSRLDEPVGIIMEIPLHYILLCIRVYYVSTTSCVPSSASPMALPVVLESERASRPSHERARVPKLPPRFRVGT